MDPTATNPGHRVLFLVLALVASIALTYALVSDRWLQVDRTQLQIDVRGRVLTWGPVHSMRAGLRSMSVCFGDGACTAVANTDLPTGWQRAVVMHNRLRFETEDVYELVALDLQAALDLRPEQARAFSRELLASSAAFAAFGWITFVGCALGLVSLAVAALLVLAGKRVALPVMPTTTAVLGLGVALICGCVFVVTPPGPGGYTGVDIGFGALGVGVVAGVVAAIKLSRLILPQDNFPGATMSIPVSA